MTWCQRVGVSLRMYSSYLKCLVAFSSWYTLYTRVSTSSLLIQNVSTGSVVMLHICGIYIIVYVHNSFGHVWHVLFHGINLFSFVCLKHLTGAYQLNGPFISGHSMFKR